MGAGHNHGPPAASENGHPGDFRKKLWIAFSITAMIVVAQAIGSVITGSLALLTDTAHAITDAFGLLVALIAGTLMLKPANAKRTWGFRRIEVIAASGSRHCCWCWARTPPSKASGDCSSRRRCPQANC